MVEVVVQKLTPKGPEDAFNVIAPNEWPETLAFQVRKEIRNRKLICEHHPDYTSIILIKADLEHTFKIDKTMFCCKEFAKQFDFIQEIIH